MCDGASANGVFYEDKWTHRHDGAAFDATYLTCKLEQYDAGYGATPNPNPSPNPSPNPTLTPSP